MSAALVDVIGAFLVVLVGCTALERALPLRREPFDAHMRVRTVHLLGRIAVVLLVVVVAVTLLQRGPVTVTAGE